jgi:hypothetical protein
MAAHEMMVRSNVTIATSGEVDRVQQHSGGLLFIGNHSRQFEFAPLMAILGQMGRVSIKNVAKFYVERQVHWALGTLGTEALLPVYPRLLATDRRNKLNVELGSRLLFRKSLQTLAESARLNQLMVDSAAQELSDDGVVNVFPCGRIVNNMKKPWRPGVGRIISAVPAADRENVLVVPYQVNNMSRLRLLGAVAARGRGPLGTQQKIYCPHEENDKSNRGGWHIYYHEAVQFTQNMDEKMPRQSPDHGNKCTTLRLVRLFEPQLTGRPGTDPARGAGGGPCRAPEAPRSGRTGPRQSR